MASKYFLVIYSPLLLPSPVLPPLVLTTPLSFYIERFYTLYHKIFSFVGRYSVSCRLAAR